ncbi:HpcH/HpaI aldolase/citrate lyase family protein [Lacibacterium aquatile]|uniref:HpcH/HpaI aldolase/citrate lyase family protein n=1 Tax=Lacibacterium aquatile TaxID=1168082 RepID=A0ABW5DY68_9PROT
MTELPKNRFKAALKNKERPFGTWIMSGSEVVAEALSHAGYDFLIVDMEHSPNDTRSALHHLQAIEGQGTTEAIVRLAWNDIVRVKQALDIGARTIMVPFVQSADQARDIVDFANYPSRGKGDDGKRGIALMHRAARYGTIADYYERAREEICLILQIETPAALAELPEMVKIPGVDAIFLGPADMSASMGKFGQFGDPAFEAVLKQTLDVCHAAGLPAGIVGGNDALTQHLIDIGFDFVASATDLGLLMRIAAQQVATFKKVEQKAGLGY